METRFADCSAAVSRLARALGLASERTGSVRTAADGRALGAARRDPTLGSRRLAREIVAHLAGRFGGEATALAEARPELGRSPVRHCAEVAAYRESIEHERSAAGLHEIAAGPRPGGAR